MAPDWSRLAPHRPLGVGDPLHVRRPQGSGDELAARVSKGGADVVAVVGPVGSGKSTELAQAASLLQKEFVVVQVLLDRELDMRQVTEADVFLQVARRIAAVAQANLRIAVSPALAAQLPHQASTFGSIGTRDLLLGVIREVVRGSSQGKLVLLLDGLEKCDADTALRVTRALLEVRDEARLVVVAPYSVVVGAGGQELQASGAHFHLVRAVPVWLDQGPEGVEGREFLCEIAQARLDLADFSELWVVLDAAAQMSGGLPRAFLQLVRAAGSYAALEERAEPTMPDLHGAARDQGESLARLLEKGDVERLREADGKSEREIAVEHRLRLLTNGLLLEYKTARGIVVRAAPLLHDLLAKSGAP